MSLKLTVKRKTLCLKKNIPFYILNNSAKNEPILISFGTQKPEEISH